MKTTVELPDDLFQQAILHADRQGRSVKDLLADGLKLVLQIPIGAQRSRRISFPITKRADPNSKLNPEDVSAAEEQVLNEEAAAHGRIA